VLIDGGPSPQALSRELGKRMPFWDRTIELVIVTHPNADYLTGLIDTVNRYRVEQVLQPLTDSTSTLWQEWVALVEEKDIEITTAQTGQEISLKLDSIAIEVLRAPVAGSN
jgi:competence protein ComEC